MRQLAAGLLPFLIGAVLVTLANIAGGWQAGAWFMAGVFFGGWVPLFLLPWLRRSR